MFPGLPEKVHLRLKGAGYKVLGRLPLLRSKKLRRLVVMLRRYQLPLPLWLGDCVPVCPYLLGSLVWYVLERVKPRDITFPSEDSFPGLGHLTLLVPPFSQEYTQIRAQMGKWLTYLKWYAELVADTIHGADPYDIIRRALDAPVVYRKWQPDYVKDENPGEFS